MSKLTLASRFGRKLLTRAGKSTFVQTYKQLGKADWPDMIRKSRANLVASGGWSGGAVVHRGPARRLRTALRFARYQHAAKVGGRGLNDLLNQKGGPTKQSLFEAVRRLDPKLHRRLTVVRHPGTTGLFAADSHMLGRRAFREYQEAGAIPRRLGARRAVMLAPTGDGASLPAMGAAHELGHLSRRGRIGRLLKRRMDQRKFGSKAAVLAEELRANVNGIRFYKAAGGRRRDYIRGHARPMLSYLLAPRGMMA